MESAGKRALIHAETMPQSIYKTEEESQVDVEDFRLS